MKKKVSIRQEYVVPLILVALWIILAITVPTFRTTTNILNLLRQTAILGVAAVGSTYVIISGDTDLSVGATMGLVGMVTTKVISVGFGIFVGILCGILAGILCGLINGVIVQFTHIPSFICTMGTMTSYRGVAELISDGKTITGMPAEFKAFSGQDLFGIPSLVVIFFIIAVVFALILARTVFGRNIYAAGSNRAVAELSGISVKRTCITAFMIDGFTSAVAGIMYALRMGSGITSAGAGYELNCIAAAVIGGATLAGGEGAIFGTIVGCLLIQTLQNGGNLLKISSFWLEVVTGVVLIAAVIIDTTSKRNRK